MSFSDEYKAGYSGQSWGVDTFSYSYQMGQNDRARQVREGTYGSDGGASGAVAGGGGIVFAAVAVIIAFCAFVVALVSYPMAAGVTGILFGISASVINSDGAKMNGVGLVFALMVPCYIIFVLAFNVEQKVANFRPYRVFRQYWRVVVGTFFVHTLCTGLHREGSNAGFFEYAIDVVATASSPFLMYLNSMRLDRKYEMEPIRFRWLEAIVAPVKNRLVPKVNESIRETPLFQVKDALRGGAMQVQVSNGMVKFGDHMVPVGNVKKINYGREYRGSLLGVGVVLPVVLIVIIGKATNEEFIGFFPQFFGLASLVLGAVLVLWGLIQATPPGRLQGPFRTIDFYFAVDGEKNEQVYLKFQKPQDERMFVQALDNGLKAMPKPEPIQTPVAVTLKPESSRLRKLIPFKF